MSMSMGTWVYGAYEEAISKSSLGLAAVYGVCTFKSTCLLQVYDMSRYTNTIYERGT